MTTFDQRTINGQTVTSLRLTNGVNAYLVQAQTKSIFSQSSEAVRFCYNEPITEQPIQFSTETDVLDFLHKCEVPF